MPLVQPPSAGTGIPGSAFTAKGDLLAGTGASAYTNLPVGGTNGWALVVDSTQATGMKWAAVSASATQVDRASGANSDYVARIKLTADTQYRRFTGLDGSGNALDSWGVGGTTAPSLLATFTGSGSSAMLTFTGGAAADAVAMTLIEQTGTNGAFIDIKSSVPTADTNARLRVQGDSNYTGLKMAPGGAANATDVRVYRGGAAQLSIDSNAIASTTTLVLVQGTTRGRLIMQANADSFGGWDIQGGGGTALMKMGPGSAAPDLSLQRSAAGVLTIDALQVAATDVVVQLKPGLASRSSSLWLFNSTNTTPSIEIDTGTTTNPYLLLGSGTATADNRLIRVGAGNLKIDANGVAATSVTLDISPAVASAGSTLNLWNLAAPSAAAISLQTGTGTAPSLQFGPGTGALDWALTRSAANIAQVGSGDTLDLSIAKLLAPASAGIALTATAGYVGVDTTTGDLLLHDGQRQKPAGIVGWAPYAFSLGYTENQIPTGTAATLAVSGGSIAVPVFVPGHMRLISVSHYIGASTTPTTEYQIYRQSLNNGNAGENTLTAVAGASVASATRTASAINTLAVATAGVYLAPGLYWLVIRNTTANTVIIGGTAVSTFALSMAQTKTLGSTIVSTNLDFVAATWAKVTGFTVAVRFNGEVFGQTTVF